MGRQPALAIRCRDPGEFITSVIEHHRGNRLPQNEWEKTYLVFIGVGDEHGVFEMIDNKGYLPVPKQNEDEFWGAERRKTEEGECEEEGGSEEEGQRGVEGGENNEQGYRENSSEAFEGQETQSPIVERFGRLQKRLRRNSFTDDIHSTGWRYHRPSTRNSEEGDEGKVCGGEGASEEYRDENEDQREGEVNEPSGYEATEGHLIQKSTHLQPRCSRRQHEQSNDEIMRRLNESNYSEEGLEEINERRHYISSQYKEGILDEAGHYGEDEKKRGLKYSDMKGRGVKYSTALKPYPYPHTLPQGDETELRTILSPDILPISSPLSSLSPEVEDVQPTEIIKSYEGQEREESPNEIGGKGREQGVHDKTGSKLEAAEGGEEREAQEYCVINKNAPQTRTHDQLVLPIREPESPIPLNQDEVPPLITPQHPHPFSQSYGEEPQGLPWDSWNDPGTITYITDERYQNGAENEGEYPLYPEPVLEILVAAENVEIIYISNLEGLRAFLTALQYSPTRIISDPPLLAIWGLVGAHYSTDEFCGEGIGNTLSLAVDAAMGSGRFLVLGEGYVPLSESEWDDLGFKEMSWIDAEVPILNGGSMIEGRTVMVKHVLGRWCRFGEDLE